MKKSSLLSYALNVFLLAYIGLKYIGPDPVGAIERESIVSAQPARVIEQSRESSATSEPITVDTRAPEPFVIFGQAPVLDLPAGAVNPRNDPLVSEWVRQQMKMKVGDKAKGFDFIANVIRAAAEATQPEGWASTADPYEISNLSRILANQAAVSVGWDAYTQLAEVSPQSAMDMAIEEFRTTRNNSNIGKVAQLWNSSSDKANFNKWWQKITSEPDAAAIMRTVSLAIPASVSINIDAVQTDNPHFADLAQSWAQSADPVKVLQKAATIKGHAREVVLNSLQSREDVTLTVAQAALVKQLRAEP